jgi:hypothetical protein
MTRGTNRRLKRTSLVSESVADHACEIKRGNRFMMLRNVLATSAAAFVCAALIGVNPQPVRAQSNPPLRALAAKGNSFDGFFQQGNTCDYCDGALCGCFFADSNGGTGTLKFDDRAPVSMAWNIELDYSYSDQYGNGTFGACWPASGMLSTYTGKMRRQLVTYTTSGFLCNTYYSNQTYTGSYIIQAGNAGYSTTSGSGALSLSIFSDYNAPVLNSQLKMSGNISRSPQSPQ